MTILRNRTVLLRNIFSNQYDRMEKKVKYIFHVLIWNALIYSAEYWIPKLTKIQALTLLATHS